MRDAFSVVVHVMLLRRGRPGQSAQDEVFLLHRNSTGFLDGFHGLPGGHLVRGESAWAAAYRECLEETNVQLPAAATDDGAAHMATLTYRSDMAEQGGAIAEQGVNLVFAATVWSGEPRVNEPHLFSAGAFHPLQQLPRPIVPWVQDLVEVLVRTEAWPGAPEFKPLFREYCWD